MHLRLPAAAGIMLLGFALTVGCQKKTVDTAPAPPPPEPVAPAPEPAKEVTESFKPETPPPPTPVTEPTVDELNRSGVLKTVYFDYDSSDIGDANRAVLRANSEWLKGNPKYRVEIGGHCDERGTIEYNIALGERRALAVKNYLVSLGVQASRLDVVSFGEERPADPGHGEDAWRLNRRAEFTIK